MRDVQGITALGGEYDGGDESPAVRSRLTEGIDDGLETTTNDSLRPYA